MNKGCRKARQGQGHHHNGVFCKRLVRRDARLYTVNRILLAWGTKSRSLNELPMARRYTCCRACDIPWTRLHLPSNTPLYLLCVKQGRNARPLDLARHLLELAEAFPEPQLRELGVSVNVSLSSTLSVPLSLSVFTLIFCFLFSLLSCTPPSAPRGHRHA